MMRLEQKLSEYGYTLEDLKCKGRTSKFYTIAKIIQDLQDEIRDYGITKTAQEVGLTYNQLITFIKCNHPYDLRGWVWIKEIKNMSKVAARNLYWRMKSGDRLRVGNLLFVRESKVGKVKLKYKLR